MPEIEHLDRSLELLVVSQDEEALEKFREKLKRFETEASLEAADNIQNALDTVRDQHIDCVLTDHSEQGIDGLRLLEQFNNDFSHMPVIILTSEGSEAVASKAIQKGVTDYIDRSEVNSSVLFKRILDSVERNRKEESLRRYKAAADTLKEALYLADPEGKILWASEGWRNYSGYTPEEVIGKDAFELLDIDGTTPEVQQEIQQKLEKGDVATLEMQVTNKYGERRDIELRFKNFELECGETGRIGIGRDITEHKEKERKLKEVSGLVKHDIRDPLEIARGNLELARKTGDEENLEVVEQALENIAMIVEDLEVIAKEPGEIEKHDCSLEDYFVEALEMLDEKPEYEVEDAIFPCSKSYFVRLLSNLIQNSIRHNDREVKISAGPLENGFYYEDNGRGISENIIDRVTEKGVSTSENGRGLGMYIVKKISDLHGWDMNVTESESGGARFEFTV